MMTMRMEITIATIGRLMKNFDMLQRMEREDSIKVLCPPPVPLELWQYLP
jgi:hypothetical protein